MTDPSPFRTKDEELAALTREISEVRALLREIAGRLGRVELHVKRAFGPKAPPPLRTSAPRSPRPPAQPPSISPAEALGLFEDLIKLWRSRERSVAEQRLGELALPDLKLLAHELGLPTGSKASKRGLTSAIMGRVNESIMLSRNTNVTQPRSDSAQNEEP